MKKIIGLLLVIFMLPGLGLAGDNPCKDLTLTQLRKQVPVPPAKIVSRRPVNGICEVILDISGQYIPVYAGKDFVIAGEMFKNRHQITQAKIDALKADKFLGLLPEIDQCVALSVRPATKPKHVIYMITDPVCPFCHQAETQLSAFANEHQTEVKILLYSVHPPLGTQKAIEACCRKLTPGDYLAGRWKKENKTEQYQCEKGKNLILHTEDLVSRLGVDSVPAFFLADGQMIIGADMNALAQAINKTPHEDTPEKAETHISCAN